MARFRLLKRCFLNDAVHEAGVEVERPDDWRGPTELVSPVGGRTVKNIPLFEKIEDNA